MRLLRSTDFSPEDVRTRLLTGTLGGLLVAAYLCQDCTPVGGWILIE
jgi:hypothetical protein